tara:strand:- start:17 stop:190 length:174 start_codon:yes stop_codon:yes gene_type:complete
MSTDEILDEVNEMTLSDALGVILANESKCNDFEGHKRTNLISAFDDIQEFLIETRSN